MKTTIYNIQKGIITAIFALVISTVGAAATKTHETPTPANRNNSEVLAANNDANTAAGGVVSASEVKANKKELSAQIEDWMSNGSYWESENTSITSENKLAQEIESWMANGTYWKTSHHDKKAGTKLTHKIKSWMSSGSYWDNDEK